MHNSSGGYQRKDIRRAVERDAKRQRRKEARRESFWQSLQVLGAVGWPIALGSGGGVLLGHYLDRQLGTGARFTLLLMTVGVILGSWLAWRAIGEHNHDRR